MTIARKGDAIEWLSAWRFSGNLEEVVPAHAPAETICIIRAEDVICDLLRQPLEVLRSYLKAFLDTWRWPIEHGLKRNVHPQLRAWDPPLAGAEVEVIRLLEYDFDIPHRIVHSLDSGPAVRAPIADRRDDVARLLEAGQLLSVGAFNEIAWADNVEPCVDEVWAPFPLGETEDGETLLVDPYYGQLYSRSTLIAGSLFYGASHEVPVIPDQETPNYGVLRVPFRAIGRRLVSSRTELEQHLARIRDAAARNTSWRTVTQGHWEKQPLFFRGQTREYPRPRPAGRLAEFREYFYGDPEALEPSLVSSAERRGGRRPDLEALWGAVVHGAAIFNGNIPREPGEEFVFRHRSGDLVKVALAQHYGLPTPALDLTSDPLIAIWFALHRLRVSDSGKASVERIATDDIAVLYVFDVPPGWAFSGELQDVPGVRPSRQRGAFVPISWGYRRNRAARYLVGAVYFRGSIAREFDADLPTWDFLFPDGTEDPLIRAVDIYNRSTPDSGLLSLLRQHLYAVS